MSYNKLTILALCLYQTFSCFAQSINLDSLKQESTNVVYHKLGDAVRKPAFEHPDYWVWGGTVTKGDDNKYHLYCEAWPKTHPFTPGFLLNSVILYCVADSPVGPFEFKNVALGDRGNEYWDGKVVFNPKVYKYKDEYLMIYTGTTYPFPDASPTDKEAMEKCSYVARANKRVGIARSKSISGPWVRADKPMLETKPGTAYSFLTSNPTMCIEKDGSALMVFKSRRYIGAKIGGFTLMAARASSPFGPWKILNDEKPIFDYDTYGSTEDPFLWKDKEGYHVIFKDMTGKLCGEFHAGTLAHSKDGEHWTIDKDPKAYSRIVKWDDDHTIQNLGQAERPDILFENGKPAYLYLAVMDGKGGFQHGKHSWFMVIPFKP